MSREGEPSLSGFFKFLAKAMEEREQGNSIGNATEDQYLLMGALEEVKENTKAELEEKVKQFVEELEKKYKPFIQQHEKDIELLWEEILTDLGVPKEKHDELFQLDKDTGEVTQLSGVEVETDEGSYKPLEKEKRRYNKGGEPNE